VKKHKNNGLPLPKHNAAGDRSDHFLNLVEGLNALIAQADHMEMGMAVRIFSNAKDELIHWGVDMNFHETLSDRFINHHLYSHKR
jgi:hypothetical protein